MHRILVTRPAAQAAELATLLRDRGFAPLVVPTVAIDSAGSHHAIDAMLDGLAGADWLVVTSANGARVVASRLRARDARLPAGVRVAAVGPASAAVLRAAGIRVDHVPREYVTIAIADGLGDVHGRRVVLARADAATAGLRDRLVERGATVEEVVAYRTLVGPAESRDPLQAALRDDLAGVAFTSSSTVDGLMRLASTVDRARARTIPAYCIGPVTARTAQQQGLHVAALAEPHTAQGLADAIADHFAERDR
jgi:uroporphyrinogen-III synthase